MGICSWFHLAPLSTKVLLRLPIDDCQGPGELRKDSLKQLKTLREQRFDARLVWKQGLRLE